MRQEDREYHMKRATAELDRAYQAGSRPAADAHMRLSSLHMQRLKDVDDRCGGSSFG
ncbi:MAG TPA: hypothetical protein VGB08_09120 [Allosphingosinicella sp.]